ncbi:MAG: GyrI-like domain-containing protein [Candidatus Competibacteraceae bacterium]|nr:GyrI-like domain-containing protein [Candidatus Competibacteraceae bacterium]
MKPVVELERVHIDAFEVVGMIHRGAYPRIPETWEKFMLYLREHRVMPPKNRVLSLYFDNPWTTPEAELRSAACIDMPPTGPPKELETFHVESGHFAKWTYVGPFSGLSGAWAAFTEAVLSNPQFSYRPAATMEFNLDDPSVTPPEKLRSELYMPVN